MLDEIDKYYFCSADFYRKNERSDCLLSRGGCQFYRDKCGCYHRKYPTPEQYKEEYGEEYPEEGAVYVLDCTVSNINIWSVDDYGNSIDGEAENVICACTPFAYPPNNWKPGLEDNKNERKVNNGN